MNKCPQRLKEFKDFIYDHEGEIINKNHSWLKRTISFDNRYGISPGYINIIFRNMEIEICQFCNEIRNIKKGDSEEDGWENEGGQ